MTIRARVFITGSADGLGRTLDLEETRGLARDVNHLGRLDAVIHDAGVYTGPHVLPVNVVAPYLLTALIDRRWADPVRPTICGSGTSPRSGLPLARTPRRALRRLLVSPAPDRAASRRP
jgi:hypothetical protein